MPAPVATNVSPTVGNNWLQQGVAKIGGLLGVPGFQQSNPDQQGAANALTNRLQQGNVQPGFANKTIGSVFGSAPSSPTSGTNPGMIPVPGSKASQSAPLSTGLAGAGKTQTSAIPQGYSYNAQGKLTNNAGLEYTAPGSSTPPGPNAAQSQYLLGGSPAGSGPSPYFQGNFDANGQPIPPSPTGTPPPSGTQTINGQGQNTTVPENVNNGGGTQTNFPSIVGGLASTAATSSPQYQAAQTQYGEANANLQKLRDQYVTQANNIATTPGDLSLANGEQGALYNKFSGQEAALTGEMSAAQSAAQTATGQQSTQQSGLAAAAGASAPQGANALGTYNPVTGQYSQYGGSSGGGAFQAGQVQGNVQAGQQFQQIIAPSYNAAQGVLGKLNGFLNSHPNINPSNFNIANQLKAWAQGQNYSDPQYPEMSQYIGEFLNTLTPLIGAPGENTNYKQQIVNSFVNGTSGTGSLQEQLNNLFNNIATTKYESIYGTGQSIASPNGSNSNQSNNATSNTSNQYSWNFSG